jgi:hypothetical protein
MDVVSGGKFGIYSFYDAILTAKILIWDVWTDGFLAQRDLR